jgi:hypothetical protein
MLLRLTDTHLHVDLSRHEAVGALRRSFAVPRERIEDARLDESPMRSIRGKLKVGLRLPGYRYACSTDRFRHFWAIRRDVPAVHVRLRPEPGSRLRELTVSSPDAAQLVATLQATSRPPVAAA